jgi:hypothetical protein
VVGDDPHAAIQAPDRDATEVKPMSGAPSETEAGEGIEVAPPIDSSAATQATEVVK